MSDEKSVELYVEVDGAVNTEEARVNPDGSFGPQRILTAFEQWQHDVMMQILTENQALHGEILASRSDIRELRKYVEELETRAAEMASPEKMQEAMSKMMGGMLG